MNKPMIRFEGFDEDWEEKKLGDVFDKVSEGSTPPTKNRDNYIDGDIPFVNVSDLVNKYVFDAKSHITDVGLGNSSAWLVPENSIILSTGATIGEVSITRSEITTKQGIMGMVPSCDHNVEFLYTLFKTSDFQNTLDRNSNTGTFASVPKGSLESIKLKLTTFEEQEQIGNFFNTLDDLISAEEEQLQNYERYKSAMLQKMFPKKGRSFPEIRFSGFDEDWEKAKLGDYITRNNAKNSEGLVDRVESVTNDRGFVLQSDQFKHGELSQQSVLRHTIIEPKMFAYNPSRINVGSLAYKYEGDYTSIVSPLYVSFFTKNTLDDMFLLRWFDTHIFDHLMLRYTEGSVRNTLNFEGISSIPINVPSLEEQEQIGNLFKSLDDLIGKKQEKIEELKETKEAFLQKMFV